MGLAPLKKLDCLFTEAGDGGICAIVSIVRSDKDGRARPRVSGTDNVSSSPAIDLSSSTLYVSFVSLICSSASGRGFAGE